MPRMIFVNLPVADLARSVAFYEAIGFTRNETFSNDQAASMVWSDTITVMLLTHDFYATFAVKPIADTHQVSAVLLCLSRDSRAEVDSISAAAAAAGGRKVHDPEENGFMYGAAFEDPDGHTYETMWMDPEAAARMMAGAAERA